MFTYAAILSRSINKIGVSYLCSSLFRSVFVFVCVCTHALTFKNKKDHSAK